MTRFFIALACVMAVPGLLTATTITDGQFTNWGLTTLGNASLTLEASGGNPGPRLNITTTTFVSLADAYGLAVDHNVQISELLSGTFTLALDTLSGEGDFGAGQGVELLVEQGGNTYGEFLNTTGCCFSSFQHLSFGGTFDPLLFSRLVGSGATHPDLSGSTLTYFGFTGYNSSNNRTLTQYYDNFSLTYTSATPEPATFVLVGLGAGVLFILRRQRVRTAE